MNDLALAVRQIRYENKAFWRNPPSAFFTFAFPLMFLVLFTIIFGNEETTIGGQTIAQVNFYVPAIVAFSVINACYTSVAITVSFQRDEGTLKRLRGTPLPAWAYLFGRIGHACFVALVLVVICVIFGAVFYDVSVPTTTLPAFLVALGVSAASFCALGLAITTVVPNSNAAPAIVNFSVLPLLFISDVFLPPGLGPQWLKNVADIFPIRHSAQAMVAAFNPLEGGSGFSGSDLVVVALWGLAGALIALKFFRWEPPES